MLLWRTSPSRNASGAGDGLRDEKGIALILVIVSMFLLSVAVLQTRAGVDLAEKLAVSLAQEKQAQYMARSGLAIVLEALAQDDPQVDSYQDDWAAANTVGAVPIAEVGWAVGKVTDEEGKFNILDLVNEEGESDQDTDYAALRLIDLLLAVGIPDDRAEEIVDSLIDWMDFDQNVTGAGAEDLYYSTLDNPYSCPNAAPASIDDLTLVKGIGPVLLYQGEGDIPPLIDFVTIYGDKKPGDRFRRVNLNTAPVQVILSLSEDMDLSLAEEIAASREGEPFRTAAEIRDVPGFPDEMYNDDMGDGIKLSDLIDVSSSSFSARITGETTMASSKVFGVFRREGESVNLVYYRGF